MGGVIGTSHNSSIGVDSILYVSGVQNAFIGNMTSASSRSRIVQGGRVDCYWFADKKVRRNSTRRSDVHEWKWLRMLLVTTSQFMSQIFFFHLFSWPRRTRECDVNDKWFKLSLRVIPLVSYGQWMVSLVYIPMNCLRITHKYLVPTRNSAQFLKDTELPSMIKLVWCSFHRYVHLSMHKIQFNSISTSVLSITMKCRFKQKSANSAFIYNCPHLVKCVNKVYESLGFSFVVTDQLKSL